MLQMSPQRFRSGSKSTTSVGSGSFGAVVEQHPHGRRAAAEDDELDAAVVDNGPVREGVCKPQCGLTNRHESLL